MALYSLRLIEAEKRSGKWRHSRTKKPRHLDMGPAGMMVDTDRRLSKVLGKRVGSGLEGGGVLLNAGELAAFLSSAATPDKRLVKWARGLGEERRFFVCALEE